MDRLTCTGCSLEGLMVKLKLQYFGHLMRRADLFEKSMSCMKRDASPGSMHDAGCLGLVHGDDPEGWYGEGGGRRVQDGFSFKKK